MVSIVDPVKVSQGIGVIEVSGALPEVEVYVQPGNLHFNKPCG